MRTDDRLSTAGAPSSMWWSPQPRATAWATVLAVLPLAVLVLAVLALATPLPVAAQNNAINSAPPAARNSPAVPAADEQRFVADEVIIELEGAPSAAEVDALAQRHRLQRMESRPHGATTVYRWRIPDGRATAEVIRELEADQAVRSVQPNYVYTTQEQASEPSGLQYANAKLHVLQAQKLSRGSGVRVAVIDSGVDVDHPELVGDVEASFDALASREKPHSHGTGVASLIAAHAQLNGVAPAARLLAVRAFAANTDGKGTTGTTFAILKGLDWSIAQHAQVINMSFGGPPDPLTARTLAQAARQGIVLVAAAGNSGQRSRPQFPADDPNVIAVAATDASDHLYKLSTPGPNVAVSAPGVDLVVALPNASYGIVTGTSFAAPLVSGVVALMLARDPTLDPKTIRNILMATAEHLGSSGRDDQFGAGLMDAYRAVEAADPKTAGGLAPIPASAR